MSGLVTYSIDRCLVNGHSMGDGALMKLLSIDPSSTRTGFAVMTGTEPKDIVEAGYLRPRKWSDSPVSRIEQMSQGISDLVSAYKPEHAVIEITSGKVGRRHRGGGAGLAVYGMAVGGMLRLLRDLLGEEQVAHVLENDWTRGVSKKKRINQIGLMYPAYAGSAITDGGGEVSDALGLGIWWFARRTIQEHES